MTLDKYRIRNVIKIFFDICLREAFENKMSQKVEKVHNFLPPPLNSLPQDDQTFFNLGKIGNQENYEFWDPPLEKYTSRKHFKLIKNHFKTNQVNQDDGTIILRIIIPSASADQSADMPEGRFIKLKILLKHSSTDTIYEVVSTTGEIR